MTAVLSVAVFNLRCSSFPLPPALPFFGLSKDPISMTGASLRADISYFLMRKRDVCETPFLIVFQYPAVFPESGESTLIGCVTVGFVWDQL